ncbi:MAG: DNA-processing protein DprA [Leptospirales bacterium]
MWRLDRIGSGHKDPCSLIAPGEGAVSGWGAFFGEMVARIPSPHGVWRDQALRVLDKSERLGIMMIPFGDPRYPSLLERLSDPPLVLGVRGTLSGIPGIAMAGTRRPTVESRRGFERLAAGLAGFGFPIVSGLAMGLDGAAHRGALRVKKKTIAVVGTGLDRVYPPFHEELQSAILEGGGAVVSEYPPGVSPDGWRFPFRNRLIVGLSVGLVVGPHRKSSGTGITVRRALEEGREVVVFSLGADQETGEGPRFLVEQGARQVTHPEEVILAFGAR